MQSTGLLLPARSVKPRIRGLTVLLDPGVPTRHFADVVESAAGLIDLVKFGWGTSVVTDHLETKIACLQRLGVDYFFGGTLFEKFYQQRKLRAFHDFCTHFGCRYVEISNGTIDTSNAQKSSVIADFAAQFHVLSEVGFKDSEQSQLLSPAMWITYIRQDLEAGAEKVLLEARESGTSGICRPDGALRYGLIEEIVESGVDPDRLVFEAPNKTLQATFIRRLGSEVNLANIPFSDAIALETLRLGLRSDTLLAFE